MSLQFRIEALKQVILDPRAARWIERGETHFQIHDAVLSAAARAELYPVSDNVIFDPTGFWNLVERIAAESKTPGQLKPQD